MTGRRVAWAAVLVGFVCAVVALVVGDVLPRHWPTGGAR